MAVEWITRIKLVIILLTVGFSPTAVSETGDEVISRSEKLNNRHNIMSDVSNSSAETVCSDFVNILLDHLLTRLIRSIPEPYSIGNQQSTVVNIENARLSGFRNVKRRGNVNMRHQEIWQSRGGVMGNHQSESDGKSDEVFLKEWRRKQDVKLGDLLRLTLLLEIPSNISMQGIAKIQWFGVSYDPEPILLALCDIEIRVDMSVYLNTTGRMGVELNDIKLEKLGKIIIQDDDPNQEDELEDYLRELNSEDQDSAPGFVKRNKHNIEWALNQFFHSTLVYMIETLMKDSLSALILQLQEGG